MRLLRFNTATRVTVGPFLDKTDGITPEVAITVTSEKLTFVVDEAGVPTLILDVAPTASAGANDMVHITGDDAGFYDLELAAANVNHLGRAMLSLTDALVHCPVFHEFMIVPANVYDSLVAGSGVGLRADVQGWLGTAPATPTTNGVPEVDVTHVSGTAQTAGDIIADTNDIQARLPAALTVDGNIKADTLRVGGTLQTAGDIMADTNDIQARLPAALTAGGNIKADSLVVSDKTGYALSAAAVQAIWDALTAALTTVGSVGKLIVDNLNATVSSRATQTSVDTVDDFLDTEIADIRTRVLLALPAAAPAGAGGLPTSDATNFIAGIAGVKNQLDDLNDISAAAVNSEVDTALSIDTYAEPAQGAPAATASLATKIGFLYKAFRNRKTQTATTLSIFNDDAVTVDHKATISDNGTTYDHGEIATGP